MLRRLSVAVATGRVAGVFLEGNKVVGTKMSRTAAESTQNAARIVQSWITGFGPDHVIAEDPKTASRKGDKTKSIVEVVNTVFEDSAALDICLARTQSYQNKYDEANALVDRYPGMKHLIPRRPPIWMPEPRNLSYFEALSLVDQVITQPSN